MRKYRGSKGLFGERRVDSTGIFSRKNSRSASSFSCSHHDAHHQETFLLLTIPGQNLKIEAFAHPLSSGDDERRNKEITGHYMSFPDHRKFKREDHADDVDDEGEKGDNNHNSYCFSWFHPFYCSEYLLLFFLPFYAFYLWIPVLMRNLVKNIFGLTNILPLCFIQWSYFWCSSSCSFSTDCFIIIFSHYVSFVTWLLSH